MAGQLCRPPVCADRVKAFRLPEFFRPSIGHFVGVPDPILQLLQVAFHLGSGQLRAVDTVAIPREGLVQVLHIRQGFFQLGLFPIAFFFQCRDDLLLPLLIQLPQFHPGRSVCRTSCVPAILVFHVPQLLGTLFLILHGLSIVLLKAAGILLQSVQLVLQVGKLQGTHHEVIIGISSVFPCLGQRLLKLRSFLLHGRLIRFHIAALPGNILQLLCDLVNGLPQLHPCLFRFLHAQAMGRQLRGGVVRPFMLTGYGNLLLMELT